MNFHCCLAFRGLAFAAAAALLLLGPAPARAADQEIGKPTAYDCDYRPVGGSCSCEGGHNSDSCQNLKESGLCKNPKDGSTLMCCAGSTCTCKIGGQPGTDCPKGSEPTGARPGAVKGRPGYIELKKPAESTPPDGVPTKPGYIWVDDHWERKRAK